MSSQVSRFGPPTQALALRREHWDKGSWENRSTSGILLLKRVNDVRASRDDTSRWHAPFAAFTGEMLMVAPAIEGIDLFKIAGRSISGWIPSLKTGTTIRQPFCSQLEERLLLWLEYHPLVASYARGDIGPQFATTYRLPIPKHAPFTIGYTFENTPHHYLPDFVGTLADGTPFLAEAGMEDD